MQLKIDNAILVQEIGQKYSDQIALAGADLAAQGTAGKVGETRGFNVGGVTVTFMALPKNQVSTSDPILPVVIGDIGWRVASIFDIG